MVKKTGWISAAAPFLIALVLGLNMFAVVVRYRLRKKRRS